MQNSNNLVNQYLIATPAIKDPLFAASLVYICEHNKNGSMGLVVNHRSGQILERIFDQLDIDCDNPEIREIPVFIGGPVNLEQGFVLHRDDRHHDDQHRDDQPWERSLEVCKDIYLTSSKDILQAIAAGNGPQQFLVLLGFSGWTAGQLEDEMQQNSWLTCSAENDILFNQDWEQKWQMAIDTLGIDLNNLSPVSGHA